MAVISFTYQTELVERFVNFGFELYKEDSNWIPPFKKSMYIQLSKAYPFYQNSANYHKHFLSITNGKVIGRVSAFINHELKSKDGKQIGSIGFFECIDDYSVADELFSHAVSWLIDEKGIEIVWGPMNFDIWHNYRLMTRGFEQKQFTGEPYNKPYYESFFIRYGFKQKQQWHSVEVSGRENIEKMIARSEDSYNRLIKKAYHFEAINLNYFKRELSKLYQLLIESFSGFLGFTSISRELFYKIFLPYRRAFHTELFTFAYNESSTLSGFAGAFLDISNGLRAMNGQNNLMAKLRFLKQPRSTDRAIFLLGGTTMQERKNRTGLGRAEFYYIMRKILDHGYEKVVVALMAEGNPVRGLLGKSIALAQRQYTLFEINKDD